MEFPIELLVLPSLTVLVVYGAYRMSAAGKSRKEKSEAMGEAGWWGVVSTSPRFSVARGFRVRG
ncbi:MAG: hypothetical protein AB1400_04820 [Pseudomonadota bacterium]